MPNFMKIWLLLFYISLPPGHVNERTNQPTNKQTKKHDRSQDLLAAVISDDKARTLKAKAKAKHYQGQGHSPKAKAIP